MATAEQRMPTPLTTAALRARKGYRSMLDCVLRGDVIGWRDARGRWLVDTADLERFLSASEQRCERDAVRGGAR
jgi:hypothetical protein